MIVGWKKFTTKASDSLGLTRAFDPYRGGQIPLPPYLGRAADAEDTTRYQTVFARAAGAVAAPTAGLHFTPELLARLPHTFVTLHVGTGTFRPVQSETIEEHRMHAERYAITSKRPRRSTPPSTARDRHHLGAGVGIGRVA